MSHVITRHLKHVKSNITFFGEYKHEKFILFISYEEVICNVSSNKKILFQETKKYLKYKDLITSNY